jgi:hypothetical protein
LNDDNGVADVVVVAANDEDFCGFEVELTFEFEFVPIYDKNNYYKL